LYTGNNNKKKKSNWISTYSNITIQFSDENYVQSLLFNFNIPITYMDDII